MKRMALLMVVGALMACGGDSTGPSDKFNGTWTGDAVVEVGDTLHFVFNSNETGNAFTGTGTVTGTGVSEDLTFTGSDTPPTVSFTLQAENETLTYAGSYAKSDSVVGILSENSTSVPLSLKKQ